ncbi:hypothetical protein KCP70_10025 [Salmonella enterica subsp. enterica]|nr:hypothetical protein KCP70_10025 [Salmonella enterica subsp. enterica]
MKFVYRVNTGSLTESTQQKAGSAMRFSYRADAKAVVVWMPHKAHVLYGSKWFDPKRPYASLLFLAIPRLITSVYPQP